MKRNKSHDMGNEAQRRKLHFFEEKQFLFALN